MRRKDVKSTESRLTDKGAYDAVDKNFNDVKGEKRRQNKPNDGIYAHAGIDWCDDEVASDAGYDAADTAYNKTKNHDLGRSCAAVNDGSRRKRHGKRRQDSHNGSVEARFGRKVHKVGKD